MTTYGKSGDVEITDDLVERLADEAERGYDLTSVKPRGRRIRDRYFVVNRYPGKHGERVDWSEFPTHVAATIAAATCYFAIMDLTGDCDEEWIVFVGSKGALERTYKR